MNRYPDVVVWDNRYRHENPYEGKPPVPFVNAIIQELGEDGRDKIGLYVGCGNGRNYVPLLEAGLRLHGVDSSEVGITQLIERCPAAQGKVFVGDFERQASARVFDYIVAIQVFQHGDEHRIKKYFANASDALKPEGRLFMWLNSASTKPGHTSHEVDRNELGGFTIAYDSGPKTGVNTHFYTLEELYDIATKFNFEVIRTPVEVIQQRVTPEPGDFLQWETIWQKK